MRKTQIIMVLILLVVAMVACTTSIAETTTLALPSNIQVISEEAFMGNTSIREIDIPKGTASIESKAFSGCSALEKVTINSRRVQIASDAFDLCPNVNLYVYHNSTGEAFAIAHGISYTLIEEVEPVNVSLQEMVGQYSIAGSGLQGGDDRLIVCMKNNAPLPDISEYHPVAIAQGGSNVYFLQFDDEYDVNDCYAFLDGMRGSEVTVLQRDAVTYVTNRGEDAGSVNQSGIMTWDDDDPMGFDDYSAYVRDNQSGSQVIAIIDTGVKESTVYNSMLYSQNFNVIPDGQSAFYSGRYHASYIASIIHDCVGDTNVRIMSVRAVDDNEETLPSIFGDGIRKAVEAGADIINISYILPYSEYVEYELQEAASKGVKIVIAAGNYNGSTADFFPANANIGSNKIVVSGLEDADRVWSRTNTGPQVTFCAPAAGIRTSYANIGEGTSFAAPMIASAYALVELDTTHGISDMIQTCKTDIGLNGKTNKSQAIGNGMPQLQLLCQVLVTDITVNGVPDVMKVGDAATLSYTVVPENATNKTISFASSNESVLQVQEAGNGVWGEWSEWSTTRRTITDSAHMQEKTSTQYLWCRYICPNCGACMYATNTACPTWAGGCGQTIPSSAQMQTSLMSTPPTEGVQDWKDTGRIEYGDDADDRWFYSDAIVSYSYRYKGSGDNELVLNAVRKGNASITLSANDESGVTRRLDIPVVQPVTSVRITADTTELLTTRTLNLSVNVLPSSADNKKVTWSSSNPSIATVSSTGVVTPVSGGTVVIRAEAQDGYGAYGEITLNIVEVHDPELIEIQREGALVEVARIYHGNAFFRYEDDEGWTRIQGCDASIREYPDISAPIVGTLSYEEVFVGSGDHYEEGKPSYRSWRHGTSHQGVTGWVTTNELYVDELIMGPGENITLDADDTLELAPGDSMQLYAKVFPEDATQTVFWSVKSIPSNANVVTIDSETGYLKAVNEGSAVVTVTSTEKATIRQQVSIIVQVKPIGITVSGPSDVNVGNTITMTATFMPDNTSDKRVVWSCSNSNATVTQSGVVTGVKNGQVTVIATSVADASIVGRKSILVKQMPISISISGTPNIFINNDDPNNPAQNASQLTATVSPSDTYDKSVTWSSSNSTIATVTSSSNGTCIVNTTLKEGTATITATSSVNPSIKATVTVRTKNKWTNWSGWSTSKPQSKEGRQEESRTQYQYRDTYWTGWQKGSPTITDVCATETNGAVYEYYSFICPNCGRHWPRYDKGCSCGYSSNFENGLVMYWEPTPFTNCPYQTFNGASRYVLNSGDEFNRWFSHYHDENFVSPTAGYRYKMWNAYQYSYNPVSPTNTNNYTIEVNEIPEYRYRDRNVF